MRTINCPEHKQQPARALDNGWFRCAPKSGKKCKRTVQPKAVRRG